MNETILAPMCGKCENEPQYRLFNRKTETFYFYSLGRECESKRQKARRLAKAMVEKVVEEVVETAEPFAETIWFRNAVQVALWKNEITGQLSDGMWENAMPMDHWNIWCNAKAVVCKADGKVGRNFSPRKQGYRLTGLIEYIGQRMMEEVERDTGVVLNEKTLRKELIDMAKIMKTWID